MTEPLFEVFDPQRFEGKGMWSPLPTPPFYRHSSYHESDDFKGVAMIVSHAVVGGRIFFFTNKKDPVPSARFLCLPTPVDSFQGLQRV